jgi:hypothetical protein
MASRKRKPPAPKKFRQVLEGEVTVDDEDGVVLWDYIPAQTDRPPMPAHGYASGGLIDAFLAGKRVRITIEEL